MPLHNASSICYCTLFQTFSAQVPRGTTAATYLFHEIDVFQFSMSHSSRGLKPMVPAFNLRIPMSRYQSSIWPVDDSSVGCATSSSDAPNETTMVMKNSNNIKCNNKKIN